MITREQAGALAALARTIRPKWDQLATMNAIAEVARFDLADIAHAVIRCAEDPAMQTPTAITFTEAEHWRPTIRTAETPQQREERVEQARRYSVDARNCQHCDDDGWQPNGIRCPHDGLTFEERSERQRKAASAARAAARPLRPLASIGHPQHPNEPGGNPT